MNNIERAAKEAEHLGFSKYITDDGKRMVIATQDEIDNVIRQAIQADRATRATRATRSLCA